MVFLWSLSDSKSPQVSRILLRILAVLSNAVIWIVSTRPPTSKLSRPLVIVPKAPITVGTFFANSLMSSMYIRWLIFSRDLLSLYPAVYFLNMWFSGIMAVMNSKRDSASPWKIPLWIFVSAKLLPRAVSSTLQVCMVFSMKFDFMWYFVHFETVYLSSFVEPYHMPFCSQSRS